MKKIIYLIFTIQGLYLVSIAQNLRPDYRGIVDSFFSNYSFESTEGKVLTFAKKKDGWHTLIIDRINNYSTSDDQVFWSADTKTFNYLSGFQDKNEDARRQNIEKYLKDYDVEYLSYGYESCPYYGYNSWDFDVINDFSNNTAFSDTLKEGLARAYSAYASRYLWYQYGGTPLNDDTLQTKLKPLELPSTRRIEKLKYFFSKSLNLYKQLAESNPSYRTLVGNAAMKLFNEQFHCYFQLKLCGYKNDADSILKSIVINEKIRAIAINYLNSCPPNTILITFGDNDTYPLLYLQEKEGFRKDISIVNYSLLGMPVYVDMIKKSGTINIPTDEDIYANMNYQAFYYQEDKAAVKKTLSLNQFLEIIKTKKYPFETAQGQVICYPVSLIDFHIDLPRLKKIYWQENFTTSMSIKLNNYVFLNDFLIMDVIARNFYERPVYFSNYYEPFNQYLQKEGYIFRLLPVDRKNKTDLTNRISAEKVQSFIKNKYTPLFTSTENGTTFFGSNFDDIHFNLYYTIIYYYANKDMKSQAREWINKYLHSFGTQKPPFLIQTNEFVDLLLKNGFRKEALTLLEGFLKEAVGSFENYSVFNFYYEKETVLFLLQTSKQLLDKYNLKSDVVETLLTRFISITNN